MGATAAPALVLASRLLGDALERIKAPYVPTAWNVVSNLLEADASEDAKLIEMSCSGVANALSRRTRRPSTPLAVLENLLL